MKKVDVRSLQMNPFTVIGDEWMLLTAGNETAYNTMTVSWGHMGVLWGKQTVVVYVRPQRYTKEFVDREELFTLSVPGEAYKKQLAYLGSHSGRDEDKLAKMEMYPEFHDGTVSIRESRLTLVCRKLYQSTLVPEKFIDPDVVEKNYPGADFHDVYVGEIIAAYTAE